MGLGSPVSDRSKGWGPRTGSGVSEMGLGAQRGHDTFWGPRVGGLGSGCPIGARGLRTGFEVSEMGLGSSVSYRSKGWGPSTGPGLGVHRKWVWGLRGVTKCYGVPGWEVWGPGCPIGATGPRNGFGGLRNGAGVPGVL